MASKPWPAPGYVPLLFKPGDGRQLAPSPPCFLGHILCSAPARALSCGFERLKDRGRIAASMSTGDDRGEELGALRSSGRRPATDFIEAFELADQEIRVTTQYLNHPGSYAGRLQSRGNTVVYSVDHEPPSL